ncbi:peptidase domain-containing ABC transporter [Teredinibacter purpureus]|uniref:peptidase domain-containing ABC transporter n=1 Tax=Teredinibacter purpureus TaxID=2731756 RepID=UPI0005F7E922|nr:peptidase domain-containing ABC transporter [Teredinibacter purpureus]
MINDITARLSFGSKKKVPLILQAETTECGLACIAMVAGYYGLETDLVSLRKKFSVSSKGATLKQLIASAEALNMSSRAVRCEIEDLSSVKLPCIVHWGMKHFAVLTDIKKNKFCLTDPAMGPREISREEFDLDFTGVILELFPSVDFKPRSEAAKLSLTDFWSNSSGLFKSLIYVAGLSLLLQLLALLSPLYMQYVVDDVLVRNDLNLLTVLAIGFGILTLVNVSVQAFRSFVELRMTTLLSSQMTANLFRHLIRLPVDYYSKRHMGDIVSRFGSIGQVQNILTHGVVSVLVDGILAVLTLTAMIVYSSFLSFIVVIFLLCYLGFRLAVYRPFRNLSEAEIVAAASESSHLMESIRAAQTIKIFQRENDRKNEWQNKFVNRLNKQIELSRWGISFGAVSGLLFGLEHILVLYFAAQQVIDSVLTLGMLYAFMSYKDHFVRSMNALIERVIEFKMIGLHLTRLADITLTECEEDTSSSEERSLQEINGRIEVKGLSYRYAEFEPWVFKDVSFSIEAGETVAITGPSGCGKSTLIKCLMGLVKPTEGEILIDGMPVGYLNNYRSQISSVMQEDQLLSGDLIDNISCFVEAPDMERVVECAMLACIYDEINKMPMQLNTLVGEMGTSFSGGQKQRIVLARALYRNPRILFMDEATSHLDVENEAMISSNIKALDITRVLVAHRLETVESAGRQIKLDSLSKE